MTSKPENNTENEDENNGRPNKSQLKRDSHHLISLGEEILKLKTEEIDSLELPGELDAAIKTALKISSRSGSKRQRQYIGKLLRLHDNELIELQVKKIKHRHDTNTAKFKRLERWRDTLVDNDKEVLNEIISHFPDIDRQHINQLIRAAHQEKLRNKPPAASRKLFKYLSELEDKGHSQVPTQ